MPLQERDLQSALLPWPQLAGARPVLINYSENHTFRLDAVDGSRFTLRIHRPDYQSLGNIESELAWLDAISRDTDLPIARPVFGIDGKLLQHLHLSNGEHRLAVLFHFIEGSEPTPKGDLVGLFGTLGNYAARLHRHVTEWHPPRGFQRQAWNASTILDSDGLWGNWRIAPGVDTTVTIILQRLDTALRTRLAAYGTGPDRYGLIHADMRLGNLLVDGEHVSLIDFDDCGFCWFAYDFAAAISFHETRSDIPQLKAAWIDAYQKVRPFSREDTDAIDSMVMLRRMALLAWIGSHIETDLAQTHLPGFAEGTANLAERYLQGTIWP